MKKGLIMKGVVVALFIATFGASTVNASAIREGEIGKVKMDYIDDLNELYSSEESYDSIYASVNSDEKNYIKDSEGNIVTYNKAADFYKYSLYEEFMFNAIDGYEDILYARKGLTAKDFLKIIVCNQPTHMIDGEYQFRVNKNSDGTMSVITKDNKIKDEEVGIMRDEYSKIINKIITDDMSSYEKAKAIYDYIYDNISYGKGVGTSSYDVLISGRAGNSDAITAITGNLLGRANLIYSSVVGVSDNNKYHYFNTVDIGDKSYVFDVSLDLANGKKYEHFLSATSKVKEYKLGNLQQQFLHTSTKDYRE